MFTSAVDAEAKCLAGGGCRRFQALQRLSIGLPQNAPLSNDGGDIPGRSHVEGRVLDPDSVRCKLLAAMVRDFDRGTLFDGDGIAVRGCQVDGGPRAGDIKRDAVFLSQDGYAISADLVGDIAVSCDPV